MADTFKCPNCAANLRFEPGASKLECSFCGGSFSIDEIRSVIPVSETEAHELDKTYKSDLEHLDAIEGASSNSFDNVEFVCNSCGGKILSDSSTSASFCPFCGSPALITQRLSDEFEPRFIIPFRYGREKAEEAFIKWCKGGKYTPVKFVSKENVAKLTGLYVPFWLYDVKSHVDVNGTAQTVSTTGNYTTITDYSYTVDGDLYWEKIPFDGQTRVNDDLMEAIEPYDYRGLKPYNHKYLPGFFADRYDQSEEDLMERVKKTCKTYVDSEINEQLKKYSSHKITKDNTSYTKLKAEYALLPVWFMHYKYLGKDYYFAMNGQTGEVAGVPPVSRVKRLMFFSVALAIVSVIFRFVAGLIMGGFVG